MIIIGNKNQITQNEYKLLKEKVKNIHQIDLLEFFSDDATKEIKKSIQKHKPELVILNLEHKISICLKSHLEKPGYKDIKIMLFSEFTSKFLNRVYIDFNENDFETKRIYHDKNKKITKRVFDFIFSLFALMLLSPIFIILSILIKIISPNGPIFFAHKRIGKNGKFFRVYKFRTMIPDAQEKLKKLLDENPNIKAEYEKDFKLKKDPRIIPGIGEFMRKTSLDELPQFFNVFIGNMSVVGPRPIVEDEIKKYGKYATKLCCVKPGVTGLWQISGRNDIDYKQRIALDMHYIDNQSFFGDIKIVFGTIKIMIMGGGLLSHKPHENAANLRKFLFSKRGFALSHYYHNYERL